MTKFDRPRNAWEQPGYTISQHTNSRRLDWNRVDNIVIHYTADDHVGYPTAPYLAAIQRSYVNSRGYSIGYSAAIDRDGVCWELRGEDNIPAATKNENGHTFAILLLVDGARPAEGAMLDRARQLIADARKHRQMGITGHRDWGATACPGDGLYRQIVSGDFDRASQPAPAPAPAPNSKPQPAGDDDMNLLDVPRRMYDSRGEAVFGAGEHRRIPIGDHSAVFVNVTIVDPAAAGYATLWGGGNPPNVSNVNFGKGQTIANSAWVPVAADNTIGVFTSAGAHILIDMQAHR